MSVVVAEVDSIGAACTKSLLIVMEQVWPDGQCEMVRFPRIRTGGMRGTVDIRLLSIAAMVLRSASHQRRFDIGGMSAIAPIATKMLRRDERRKGPGRDIPRSAAAGQLCVLPAPMVAAILPRNGTAVCGCRLNQTTHKRTCDDRP